MAETEATVTCGRLYRAPGLAVATATRVAATAVGTVGPANTAAATGVAGRILAVPSFVAHSTLELRGRGARGNKGPAVRKGPAGRKGPAVRGRVARPSNRLAQEAMLKRLSNARRDVLVQAFPMTHPVGGPRRPCGRPSLELRRHRQQSGHADRRAGQR